MSRKRPPAKSIRPAPWHDEFLAWIAAGLGPKAAALEVGKHPTRAMQVRWTDTTFQGRWIAIQHMREAEDWAAVQARLAEIRARPKECLAEVRARKKRVTIISPKFPVQAGKEKP